MIPVSHSKIKDTIGKSIKNHKVVINHASLAQLAWGYSEVRVGLQVGWRRLPASSKTCTGVVFGASRAFAVRETCTGVVFGAS